MDNTYDHTIYFQDITTQRNYFLSLTKYTLSALTYQRANRLTMRVELLSDNLYDCNYLMFQNTAYGNKWFYAFINEVNYINDVTCEIVYQLDVMQSWYFQYSPQACYIEREHTATDVLGENIIEESLNVGEYKYLKIQDTNFYSRDNLLILAATTEAPSESDVGSHTLRVYSGVYSGVMILPFKQSDVGSGKSNEPEEDPTIQDPVLRNVWRTYGDINVFIDKLTQDSKSDAIVSIFMMPKEFVEAWYIPAGDLTPAHFIKNLIFEIPVDMLGTYRPRNNKLFTAPYNQIYVSNNDGKSANYKCEFFKDFIAQPGIINPFRYYFRANFEMSGFCSPTPEIGLYPLDYKGVEKNKNERIIVDNFPQCSFNIDSYKAWMAQRKYSLVSDTLSSAGSGAITGGIMGAGTVVGAPIGAAVGAVAGAVKTIASSISEIRQHAAQPNIAKGQQTNGLNVIQECLGFTIYQCYGNEQNLKIIDDYFDRFGYACKENKVPGVSNRNMPRPHWAFIKTIGCTITGSMPADDMKEIISIYNTGITFWANGAEVGNYSLDNRPV